MNTLLITTSGRSTGTLHRTALIYGRDGERHIVVGSNGGDATTRTWYLNLLGTPEVEVQVGAERFRALARPAAGQERARLWEQMASIWPDYDRHQEKVDREIPVVIIERA